MKSKCFVYKSDDTKQITNSWYQQSSSTPDHSIYFVKKNSSLLLRKEKYYMENLETTNI